MRAPLYITASRVLIAVSLLASSARSQQLIPGVRPSDQRLALPPLEPAQPERAPILPSFPIPDDSASLSQPEVQLLVREIRITGNTVLSTALLEAIAAPFESRPVSWDELIALRDQLTRAYVERGFVTSGAVIPDQAVRGGVVEVRIVEGTLENLEIETDGRFRASYIQKRLASASGEPVNVRELERRLQLLQQDPRIERVEARLVPAETRGHSILHVALAEAPWYQLGVDFDNYRSPSIGALGGSGRVSLENLIGVGDGMHARFTGSEGLRQVEARFSLPVTAYDTLFALRYQGSWAEVVDSEFDFLEIESESQTGSVELEQPLYRSLHASLQSSLRFERRHSASEIGLLGIGVPTLGADDGVSDVTVLRFGLEGSYRTQQQAVALRSTLSCGVDALGATRNPRDVPDGRFVSWLGQAQAVSRLPWLGAELLARFDVQLTDDPLLPLEQLALGGRYSVRGYRENALVRDNGLVGSLEARLLVFQDAAVPVRVDIVPFFDAGRSWNTDRPELGPGSLLSAGIGIRSALTPWSLLELYWGHRLKHLEQVGEGDLQDDGVHFRVSLDWR